MTHPLEMVLPHVRYRDWRFEVQVDRDDRTIAFLTTCIRVPDSVTGEPKCIFHRTPLPYVGPESRSMDWLGWLRHEIHRIELHEADEHLIVAGQRPYFPEH